MPSTPSLSATSPAPVAADGRLQGSMNTTQLVLTVLAFSSPLVCLAGYFSLTIMVAGSTAPVAFLAVTILVLIFAAGYVVMTRRMPRAGAFYAYISSGLGRPIGLGSAFLAGVSYTIIGMGVYCFAGMTVTGLITSFSGPEIPWWIGSLAVWILVAIVGYFNIEFSARVLMWIMLVEVGLAIVFNVAVVGQGGADGLTLKPFSISEFAGGEVSVALLFALIVFVGFEATALYRDEVKDPDKTIGRATYISVIFIGLLYTLTVWVMVMAFGNEAEQVANTSPESMFAVAADRFVGPWFTNTVSLLILTAAIAAILSIHNTSTRYLFNLSADGALPRYFARVHPRFRSPSRASVGISVLVLAGLTFFTLNGSEPASLYAQLAGLGNMGVFVLMSLVSFSIIVWFRREGRAEGESVWAILVAPAIAGVSLAALTIFAMMNFDLVVGGQPGENLGLLAALVIVFTVGVVVAVILRIKNPAGYLALGRHEIADAPTSGSENQDVDDSYIRTLAEPVTEDLGSDNPRYTRHGGHNE